MTKTLYIVRHGNTFDKGDEILRVGGRTDLPLSQSGQAQAEALAEAFKNVPLDACFSSPLKRTMRTAEAICQDHNLKIRNAEFLREIDYGPDEGKPEQEVIARIGEQALQDWEVDTVVPNGWNIDPKYYRTHWAKFIASLESPNTVVVTSNGVARFLLDALSLTVETRKMKTGGVSKLNEVNGNWTLQYWGVRPPFDPPLEAE
ncbi:histidine phosphatase family protein [Litorimonas haliclonae]|uniref:histidine phosphatase family protein n=1 Tax=Litorimonas haliclonae TaxID=2081977 RepID=UPI0039EECF72